MRMAEEWLKTLICLSFLLASSVVVRVSAARPRFDVSTDMGMVLVPADAEVDSVIFRLRATDQDADFPLVFEIIATTSPIVKIDNLPCTLYNKVCQANVILTRRLVPGRLHDFVVRVRDSKGDVNSMQATISVTNSTTPRDRIFPHIPSLIMVPEQPKELFKIRQRQMGSQTKGIITLIGELDFETQSMYTLTMYATDPYTIPGKDTRNIAGCHVVVIVQDVQDVPPVFTLAPPLTKINNTVQPGDIILRVHAEDGDKGVPREVTYGLVSEGNPFTTFFNVSETTGEITLAKPLEELTKITHVGAPIILKIVAEEIRTMRDEPPAQATIVELGLLLGEPGNNPPYFENENYVAWLDENAEPGTIIQFTDVYSTRVKDEDIGKAGVFALKLKNNNGTFEVSPSVAERSASFVITVRDSTLIDYEKFKSLRCTLVAQEVGPATDLSASVPVTIFLRDVNDNPPIFDVSLYTVTLPENPIPGTKVIQVHATDRDSGAYGRIQYVRIVGDGGAAFEINPDSGVVSVTMGSIIDRERTPRLELMIEARDEDGRGLRGVATLIVNILDVNDNAPIFERAVYDFALNGDLSNFTAPAFIKAVDADAEPPNNVVRYEIVNGNYDNKFQLDEETGELTLREVINNKARKARRASSNLRKQLRLSEPETPSSSSSSFSSLTPTTVQNISSVLKSANDSSQFGNFSTLSNSTSHRLENKTRTRRAEDTVLFILTARAYDLGVPHLSNTVQIRIMHPTTAFARIVMFVMPGENPDPKKTAETLATITGSRVTIQEIKPYAAQINPSTQDSSKRSVVVAKVEHNGPGTLVDVNKIRESLAANGFGVISGMEPVEEGSGNSQGSGETSGARNGKNISITQSSSEEVTVYKAENKLLTWLLVLLGLLILAALITLVTCCVCSSCPFYMEPRKRRVHSAETIVMRTNGRPKRHLHRKPLKVIDVGYCTQRKEAWSADPERQQWQFNRRNTKNLGIASLPGDAFVAPPGHRHPDYDRMQAARPPQHSGLQQQQQQQQQQQPQYTIVPLVPYGDRVTAAREGVYTDDAELDSLRRHEKARGSNEAAPDTGEVGGSNREQHFYRDGNAEVLRLVTRGQIEEHPDFYHDDDGKDILMQRFIEDQKARRAQQEASQQRDSYQGSIHDGELDHSVVVASQHKRAANEPAEIIIIPERLEMQRQPNQKQRLERVKLINEPSYGSKDVESDEYTGTDILAANNKPLKDAEIVAAEASKSAYRAHDAELVRQNALLTRLLLEREGKGGLHAAALPDYSSFLETQSLPGQIATATQTDRTTATQTENFARSRSDTEDMDEDSRTRRKSKSKGKVETKENFKQTKKTIWVRTPIPEESSALSPSKRRSSPSSTKIEVTESSRKVSVSPDVLKEFSSSLKSNDSDVEEEKGKFSKTCSDVKSAVKQKMPKIISRNITVQKKKIKESTVNNSSTTSSPDGKEKNILTKNKIRKKPVKPPRKRLEKKLELEKSNFMEPSFKVLERELSNFQQKVRQFSDDKLKILKKRGSKTEKESEDDSAATYNITKKSEVMLRRTTRSQSRETSPTKITVEEKTQTLEEGSKITERKLVKQKHVASSDQESSDKSKKQSSSSEIQKSQDEATHAISKIDSQLQKEKQQNDIVNKSDHEELDNTENVSIMKSDWSPVKSKQNSDSSKTMNESPVKKSKSTLVQRTEKKNKETQKNKVSPIKNKTVSEWDKRKSKRGNSRFTSSDDSKLSSPRKSIGNMNKKSATSEEEKSHPETKSITTKDSPTFDQNAFLENVKSVVEQEVTSLIQKAKETVANQLSSSFENNEKSKVPQSPLKTEKTKTFKSNSQNKKQDSEKSKSTNDAQKNKKKSMSDKSSSDNPKSDDAISFIVIEKNKTAANAAEYSKKLEAPLKEVSKSEGFSKTMSVDSANLNEIIKPQIEEKIEKSPITTLYLVGATNVSMANQVLEKNENLLSDKIEKSESLELSNTGKTLEHVNNAKDSDEFKEDQQKVGQNISTESNESETIPYQILEETVLNEKKDEQTDSGIQMKLNNISGEEPSSTNQIFNASQGIEITDPVITIICDEKQLPVNSPNSVKESIKTELEKNKENNLISENSQQIEESIKPSIEFDEAEKIASEIVDDTLMKVNNILKINSLDNMIDSAQTTSCPNENQTSVSDVNSNQNNENIGEPSKIPLRVDTSVNDNNDTQNQINMKNSLSDNEQSQNLTNSDLLYNRNVTNIRNDAGESSSMLPTYNPNNINDSKSNKTSNSKQDKFDSPRKQAGNKKESTSPSTQPEKCLELPLKFSQSNQLQGQSSKVSPTQSLPKKKVNHQPQTLQQQQIKESLEKSSFPKSPIKLPQRKSDYPPAPLFSVTDATGFGIDDSDDEDDDDDSSCASDMSNKTALHTRPYGTPRHSISSDGETVDVEGATAAAAAAASKPCQKWSLESEQTPGTQMKTAIFPQKIEVPPIDKPKYPSGKAMSMDQPRSPTKKIRTDSSKSMGFTEATTTTQKPADAKTRTDHPRMRPVIVGAKRKEQHYRSDRFTSRTESFRKISESGKIEDSSGSLRQQHQQHHQRRVEIRSKHLKLHVSHHYRQTRSDDDNNKSGSGRLSDASSLQESPPHVAVAAPCNRDPEITKARSRYMAWYQEKRAEAEKRKREKKEAEVVKEQRQRPPRRQRGAKSADEHSRAEDAEDKNSRSRERAKSLSAASHQSNASSWQQQQQQQQQQRQQRISRLRIRPLVNVESEQLKAIVRQGRKLRKTEAGGRCGKEDPPVQIFAPQKPPREAVDACLERSLHIEPRHHLVQHSEYKYERIVQTTPFYLHQQPPPVPHPSPEGFQDDSSEGRRPDDDLDSGIAVSMQSEGKTTTTTTTRLRHQQLLDKKSVFDIAYSGASPTHLRSDSNSSTPPT
uniref:Cadherin domain-containing protein n=1 Tax=Trichogramma kaykai TaxID=54128 RepID=A0ABD2XJQ4_9HYME